VKPAVGYVRVSTEGQAVEGVSIAAQRAKIDAWAIANDHALAAVYSDMGLSGGRADNRPALQAALDQARTLRCPLVVYSLSRLARSVKDTIEISERLDKAGADLVSLTEKIDTTSAAGKMIFRILAVLAEFERDLTSERTVAALAHKRSNGERVSGKAPYGYRFEGGAVVKDNLETATVAIIKDFRDEGLSAAKIALKLTEMRLPARGEMWTKDMVRRALEAIPGESGNEGGRS